jgi:hypothetical protein
MAERLRDLNQGTQAPEFGITFAGFVDTQWKVLALPNFKGSTQHGNNTVVTVHVLPAGRTWRLRNIERIAIGQWIAEQVPEEYRKGPEFLEAPPGFEPGMEVLQIS